MNSILYFNICSLEIFHFLKKYIFNQTPLHIACENDNKEIVKFLISKGANINAVDYKLNTPLHIACSNNRYEIIKLLILSGAEIMCYDENDETPLHKVCKNNNSNHAVNFLLSKGCDAKYVYSDGILSSNNNPLQESTFCCMRSQ